MMVGAFRRLAGLALIGATLAQETTPPAEPDTPEQAADRVLAAWTAGDRAVLKELAGRDDPDPWLVADSLCVREEHDVAEAFAKAAPRKDIARLPEYVASKRGNPPKGAARATLRAADEAIAAGDFAAALTALEDLPTIEDDSIAAIRIGGVRAVALLRLRRPAESGEAFFASAKHAARLGWLSRASAAFYAAAKNWYGTDLRRALMACEEQLKIEEARGNRTRVASTLRNTGTIHSRLGNHARALEFYDRELKIREESGDHAGTAGTQLNIGVAHKELGNYERALEHYELARKLSTESGDRVGIAAALINIGVVHSATGHYKQALDYHERGLLEAEAAGDRRYSAVALTSIGLAHKALGDLAKALEYQERALKLERELGDRAEIAGTLINIGMIHHSLGNYLEALEHYERGLAEAEDVGHRRWAANALGNIAVTHERLGNYQKALEYQGRALERMRQLGDRAGVARTLCSIGDIHRSLGNYTEALSCQSRAREVMEKLGDRAGVAAVFINLGSVSLSQGNYARALQQFERALAEAESIGHRERAAIALGSIGTIYNRLGNYAEALEYQERTLKVREELGDRAGIAASLDSLGGICESQGKHAEALQYRERALRLMEELGDKAGQAAVLVNIGISYNSLGNHQKALEHYERGLAGAQSVGRREWAANALRNMGSTHNLLGDHRRALDYHKQALAEAESIGASYTAARSLQGMAASQLALEDPAAAAASCRRAVGALSRLASGLAEGEGASLREQFLATFETGTQAALALGDPEEVCFFLESGRAATLLEVLGGRDVLREAVVPEELRIEEAQARRRELVAAARYEAALGRGVREESAEARRRLDEAREEVAGVIAKIQRHAKAGADIVYPKADSLADIRGRVRDGETLVLYSTLGTEAVALVVTHEGARIVRLGEAEAIREACGDVVRDAAKLRARVVDPLGLPEKGRVLVSPAGELSYVPFALLLGDRDVAYVPSGTTYGVLRDDAGARGEAVLALGDPDYSGKADPRELALMRSGRALVPLPGSRLEAEAVGTRVLLRGEATEAGLAAALASRPRWRAVHLACHGLVNTEEPELSSLALSGGDFLTTLEVFRLKAPADLVVLSACETAKGKVYRAEGVIGFVRAFMFAGAPRVLVSLWKVDDAATRELMARFYELWNPKDGSRGLPTATALKKAMEFVRDHPDHQEWKDPEYWAAWQLWGLPD